MGRATGLDLVRVCAAFCVFLYHGRLFGDVTLGGPLAVHGNLAVPVFFALSGYLVYRPFTRGRVQTADYLLRRAARIVPAMAVASVAIGLLLPKGYWWLLVVLWSLVVEAMYYEFLPLFARLSGRHERLAVVALVVPSIAFCQSMGPIELPRMLPAMPLLAPGWWWAFAPGMFLALVERDRPDLLRPRLLAVTGVLLLSAGLAVLDLWPVGVADHLRAVPLVLGAVGIMGATIDWRPGSGAAAVALAADVSYPFYLWHAPVLAVLAPMSGGYTLVAAGFVMAGVASTASVLLVERPFRRAWARSHVRERKPEGPRGDLRASPARAESLESRQGPEL